jgi:streptomycin 6-kinase
VLRGEAVVMSHGPSLPAEGVVVPASLATTAGRWNGEAGRLWLDRLPRLVADMAVAWDLQLGAPYEGGKCALVLRATQSGQPVVLKVTWPDAETRPEPDALWLWDGDGAVRLLAADERRGALLLERLEPGTPLSHHPDRDEALAIACGLVRRLRRRPPSGHRFRDGGDLASWLARSARARWASAGEPFERALVDAAVGAAEGLLVHPPTEPPVVVNRDLHLGNVLAAEREPWLVIDPKPMVGEPAFDGAHLLADALAGDACIEQADRASRLVAEELGVDVDRLRDWALVRAVDFALWAYEVREAEPNGRLALARSLAALAGS